MKIIAKRVSISNGIFAFLTLQDIIIQDIPTKWIISKEKFKNTQQDAKRHVDIVLDKRNLNQSFVVHLFDLGMACVMTKIILLNVSSTSKFFTKFCNLRSDCIFDFSKANMMEEIAVEHESTRLGAPFANVLTPTAVQLPTLQDVSMLIGKETGNF